MAADPTTETRNHIDCLWRTAADLRQKIGSLHQEILRMEAEAKRIEDIALTLEVEIDDVSE